MEQIPRDPFHELIKLRETADKHSDSGIKEVGDRVNILDYSSVTFADGNVLLDTDYEDFDTDCYFIVIAVNQNHSYESFLIIYDQDLLVVNPLTKKQYRVTSRHTRIKS